MRVKIQARAVGVELVPRQNLDQMLREHFVTQLNIERKLNANIGYKL
jgi:hypothetical protein